MHFSLLVTVKKKLQVTSLDLGWWDGTAGQQRQSQEPDRLDPNPRHQISLGLSFLHMGSEDNNRIMGLLKEFDKLTHRKYRICQWRLVRGRRDGRKSRFPPSYRGATAIFSSASLTNTKGRWQPLQGKSAAGALSLKVYESKWHLWRFSLHTSLT